MDPNPVMNESMICLEKRDFFCNKQFLQVGLKSDLILAAVAIRPGAASVAENEQPVGLETDLLRQRQKRPTFARLLVA
jgi:hypothetical protein